MEISARSGRRLSSQDANGPVFGAALVLHGGRVASREPVTGRQLAVIRVALLASALHRRVADRGIAVWNLRFGVRGWNGAEASPVADALWALEQLRLHSGVPVVLVGHSMGGRTALRVAGHESVRGVVALAPWLPEGEPIDGLRGKSLVIGHGTADRITDPAASARYAERATAVARSVTYREISGAGHALLKHQRQWNQLTATGVFDVLNQTDHATPTDQPEPRRQSEPGEVPER
jgi:dienelactone hydrolase